MSEAAATPSKHVDANAKEAWVLTQKKTFTKWFNNHLKKKGFSALDDAEVDFESGIKIIQITSALYGLPIPKHNANPKLRPHKLDNIQIGLNMLEEAKVKTNFLKSSHFVDHDVKMILGFMWAVILDYAIKGISEDDTTAKEGLLLWCRKKTAGYREIDPPTILNFTGHWRNGLAFCALIHKHQPGLIEYDSLDASNAASNLELAFSVAESLGIPRLLDVEDVNVEKPDERSIMTQVSEYFHRFSAQSEKEVAARRAAKFLAFARETVALEQDYESGARELLAWVQSTIERFQAEQSASSMEEAVAAVEQLRTFVLEEKPKKSAAKLDLESKYAEIQQRLRVNGRTQWECPAELTPQSIDAAFDAQFNAEKIYATAAREKRFAFIHKEEATVSESDLQEMRDSYKHFDHDKDGAMDKTEFKAALSAMGVPVKDDTVLATLFTKVTNGAAAVTLEQWIAYLSELRTDKDTPEQITDAFRTLADGRSTVSVEGLRVPPLSESDVAYLSENIPRAEDGGLDYAAFVAREFAQRE